MSVSMSKQPSESIETDWARQTMTDTPPILEVEALTVSFANGSRRFKAADRVSLSIYPGQTLAVVGESGSGKSVSAMSVLGLLPHPPAQTENGRILWSSDPEHQPPIDLCRLGEADMRKIRGNDIAMVFQEPMTSLNPVHTIGEQITEAVVLHHRVTTQEARQIALEALDAVGIADPAQRLKAWPHQLSGGMRQRAMIAMALACKPRLLLADEPTTALDVTIQAQILELLRKLQCTHNMGVMLITHDLGVVAENADTVAVMCSGRVVEYASVETIFDNPLHPYTRGLLASMPKVGHRTRRLPTLGETACVPEGIPGSILLDDHATAKGENGGYGHPDATLQELAPGHWVLCRIEGEEAPEKAVVPRLNWRRETRARVQGQ